MGDGWYTRSGASGELTVEWRDDGWYVADAAADGDVKCILPDDVSLQRPESPQEIDVRVGKFVRAVERGPSYLFLDRTDEAGSTEGTATDSPDGTSATPNQTKERRQTDDSRSSDRTMLDKITREKIGDEEFTASEEDEESVVGQAKKRARNQGRDPAIDPAFQQSNNDDEAEDKDKKG